MTLPEKAEPIPLVSVQAGPAVGSLALRVLCRAPGRITFREAGLLSSCGTPGAHTEPAERRDDVRSRKGRVQTPLTIMVPGHLPATAPGKVGKAALRDRISPGNK